MNVNTSWINCHEVNWKKLYRVRFPHWNDFEHSIGKNIPDKFGRTRLSLSLEAPSYFPRCILFSSFYFTPLCRVWNILGVVYHFYSFLDQGIRFYYHTGICDTLVLHSFLALHKEAFFISLNDTFIIAHYNTRTSWITLLFLAKISLIVN